MHGQTESPIKQNLPLLDTFNTYRRAGMTIYRSNMQQMAYLTTYNSLGFNTYNTTLLLQQDELFQDAHAAGLKILNCFNAIAEGTYNFSNPGELQPTLTFHQYMINCYGAYVDMWELGNEISGVTQTYRDTITEYCAVHDPYNHPITVSNNQWRANSLTWINESALGAASLHVYDGGSNLILDNDIVHLAYNSVSLVGLPAMRSHYPKQVLFAGEQGNANPIKSYDPERFRLHIWTDTTNEGGPIFWLQMDKNYLNTLSNLYIGTEERSMARVWANEVNGLDVAVKVIPNAVSANLHGYTMGSSQNVIGYFVHSNSHTTYLTGAQVMLNVPADGMLGQWIDPRSGNILQNFVVNSGTQTLTLPDFLCDVVLRLRPANAAPVVEFTSGSYLAQENQGSVTLTVSRSNNSAGAVSVAYMTSDGQGLAGTNYTATSGILNWADGDTAPKQIVVPLSDDGTSDNNKDFQVSLTNPTGGAVLGGNDNTLVTSLDIGTAGGGSPATYVSRAGTFVPYWSKDSVSGAIAGTPTALTYQISNTGSANLTLGTATLGTPVNCTASITTAPASTVAVGSSTNLVVTITPAASGAWSCPVSFSTNDPDVVYDLITTSPTHTYYLTPTGLASITSGPKIAVARGGNSIVNSGTDTVSGTAAGTATVLSYPILNLGSASLTLGTPTVTNLVNCTASISTAPASSVSAGGNTTLGLTITPTASGTWSYKVSFATNDSSANPANWSATGTSWSAAEPEIAVNRGFDIPIGTTETLGPLQPGVPFTVTYQILNSGAGTLTVGTAALSSLTNCSASVSTVPAASVAPGSSTTIGITVTPTSTGATSCKITLPNNDANENPYTWSISGTSAATPFFALTRNGASIYNFGTDPVTSSTPGTPITLTYLISNPGTGNLTITAPTIGFQNNCSATITTTPATTIAGGSSTTMVVTVTPTNAGLWNCPFSGTTNDTNFAADRWSAHGVALAASGAGIGLSRGGNPIMITGSDIITGTAVGSPTVLSYQIANAGAASLTVGTPVITSVVNCTASLSTSPAASVSAGGNTNLGVTVTPTGAGAWFCNVSFATNISAANPATYIIGGSAVAAAPASLGFSNATYSQQVNVGGSVSTTITVNRTGGSTGAVSVNYSTANGTGTVGIDYTATNGVLNWADGDLNPKTFSIQALGGSPSGSSRTVNLTLSQPGGNAVLGTQNTATLTINDVGQTYASWAAANGLTGNNALATANPARDGIVNLIKYALGMNPNQVLSQSTDGTTPGLPWVFIEGTNECMIYQKDTTKTDITYTVQWSTDLTTWSTAGITESVQSTSENIQTIKAALPVGTDTKKFLRLKVSRP